ncbi:hypothetical protein [Nocardiopsis halotolerans]|uniref:hypothetical protein n=1 Tax=Nocardiopsis halotolerans TaxID=124252 RepID=UPI000348448D|nr:hypothetical protein [Nocardiopsis halotolerans]
MPESTYHQIHFAWAEPTLLGRVGPGPAASSLPESEQPALRSWRDRLVPALTADYRSALPGTDPADYPETLWARAYPDGQAALVYRWPGDVRSANAWAIVGPAHGLTLPRLLSLHENPNTRPAHRRPPAPGWATMDTLPTPRPWERTAAPGAVRTRDRRAAETTVEDEPILVGAVAAALHRPDQPIHIALAPERADLWQAVQMRFLWGLHRVLHDVLTPPRAIPAAGWSWSFSTYDPVLGTTDGQHLAFGPPTSGASGPFLEPPAADYRRVAEGLVAVLREEGGDALARHLRERGVHEAPTFADRRELLRDWLDPRPPERSPDDVPAPERLADGETAHEDLSGTGTPLPDLPEAEAPGEEETGPQPPSQPRFPRGRPRGERLPGERSHGEDAGLPGDPVPGVPGGQRSLRGILDENAAASAGPAREREKDARAHRGSGDTDTPADEDNESLWPETAPEPLPGEPGPDDSGSTPGRHSRPRIAPARGSSGTDGESASSPPRIFGAPEPHDPPGTRRPRILPDTPSGTPDDRNPSPSTDFPAPNPDGSRSADAAAPEVSEPSDDGAIRSPQRGGEPSRPDGSPTVLGGSPGRGFEGRGEGRFRFLGRGTRAVTEPDKDESPSASPISSDEHESLPPSGHGTHTAPEAAEEEGDPQEGTGTVAREGAKTPSTPSAPPAPSQDTFGTGGAVSPDREAVPPPESLDPQETHGHEDAWTITASPGAPAAPSTRNDGALESAAGTTGGPARGPDLTDGPHDREPADAPPLPVGPDTATTTPREGALDYAAETEPGPDAASREEDTEDNWPTQYVDLPLSRLERWHSRHGPEGARTDVADARAAVRAERAELQRVREERDHYHAEVQELRREVARLDRPWLEGPGGDDEVPETVRPRRWPSRVLVVILLVAFLATGLEAGARFGLGAVDLVGSLITGIAETLGET